MDLAIIVVYLLAMVAVGVYVYRRKQASSSDGFFVANRSGGIALIVGSLCATFIGSSVAIGMAGRGYRWGLPGAWWLLVGTIGLLILGFFFARRVRRFGLYTLPELLERQYGTKAGMAASVLIVVAWVAIVAAQIIAAGKILTVFSSCAVFIRTWLRVRRTMKPQLVSQSRLNILRRQKRGVLQSVAFPSPITSLMMTN